MRSLQSRTESSSEMLLCSAKTRMLAVLLIVTSLGLNACERPAPRTESTFVAIDESPAQGVTANVPTESVPPIPTPSVQPPADTKQISAAPIFVVFQSKSGSIRVELHAKAAPRACANFLNLVRRCYYTGRPWEDFSPVVRQLGARIDVREVPYSISREFSPKFMFDIGGRLCLANTTEDANARGHPCRIFLTVKPQERWNLVYVVFGTITDGLDVAARLVSGEPVTSIEIEGDADALLAAHAKLVAEWNTALDTKPLR